MEISKEFRAASWEADQSGKISGYALVFNQRTVLYKDPETGAEYGEQIDRHALDGADLSDVVLKYNHQGRVLARTRNNSLKLSVDDHGLKIEADLTGSDEARSILQDIQSGLLDKMSFAFTVAKDGEQWDTTTRTRTVLKIDRIFDVAVVDFPAYEQTEVSARSAFESFAEPERRAYRVKQVWNIRENLQAFAEDNEVEDFGHYGHRGFGYANDEEKTIEAEADRIAKRFLDWKQEVQSAPDDLESAQTFEQTMREDVAHLRAMQKAYCERRAEIRRRVANGTAGETNESQTSYLRSLGGRISAAFTNHPFFKRKDSSMNNAETREFYSGLLEKRAAGTTATMANVIPQTVLDQYVIESAPGAFLMDSVSTNIAHSGDLTIPIATLQDVQEHEENAEIEANGYVPGKLTISHKEYAYHVGYSRIGVQLGVEGFMNIIGTTLMSSMMKKMDGICYDAVAGLAYSDNNAVSVSSAPALADFVAAAGKLPTDYINRAKWYMSSATYFNWVIGLTDTNKKPIFDPSKKIEDQALLGYPLAIDSQIPDNTIYFGDGSRIHLNYADPVQIVLWTDHDHNTEKAGVNTVAGAAVEVGSFVKLSK